MIFILCIILPPIAAAISGGFSSFFINLILTCFGWLPGIVHAIMVTNKSIVEEQNIEAVEEIIKDVDSSDEKPAEEVELPEEVVDSEQDSQNIEEKEE